jgi:hypothetical protein
MLVQGPKIFEYLYLPLSCQILVSEEDDTALVDQCGELIELLIIQLTELNIL